MGRVNPKATLSLKTWCRSPKTVAKRKFHLLAVNPLGKNVASIAQNCSETRISFSVGSTLSLKTWCRSPKTVAKRKVSFSARSTLSQKTWCRSPKTVAKRKFHLLCGSTLSVKTWCRSPKTVTVVKPHIFVCAKRVGSRWIDSYIFVHAAVAKRTF